MKSKLRSIKKLKEEFDEFSNILNKIQKEHEKQLLEQMNKLISEIALGENLEELQLREKYLSNFKKRKTKKEPKNTVLSEDNLLDKIMLNDQVYYYENKEEGNIFDTESNKVGVYSKNQFILKNNQ